MCIPTNISSSASKCINGYTQYGYRHLHSISVTDDGIDVRVQKMSAFTKEIFTPKGAVVKN